MHETENQATHCLTCGTPLPPRSPRFDTEEGVYKTPEPYCSIHCEHYAGLQRATEAARAS